MTRKEILEIYNRSSFDPIVVRKGFDLGNKFHEWLLKSEYTQEDLIVLDPHAADGTMMRILGDTVKNIYVMDSEKRNRALLHRDRRWKVIHEIKELPDGLPVVVISLSRYMPGELPNILSSGYTVLGNFCLDIQGNPVVI